MNRSIEIFPKALVTAARTFANRPAVVGEVLVALVAADAAAAGKTHRDGSAAAGKTHRDGAAAAGKTLSEVQRYIVAACREEMAELAARRAAVAERKRRQRERERVVGC